MIIPSFGRRVASILTILLATFTLSMTSQTHAQGAGTSAHTEPPPAHVVLKAGAVHPVQHRFKRHGHPARRHWKVQAARPRLATSNRASADIGDANAAARVQPERTAWLNAIQQYAWGEGALYQVYTAPGQVTDIVLQDGEELTGSGPVAAGDTARWIIGDTQSGSGVAKRVHILVKPTRGDITTNLVINTDRRTYHLELRATPATSMAAVSWSYPADALIALKAAKLEQEKATPVASGVDVATLNFHYHIDGDKPAWRPMRAFDDGRQAFIEFPEGIAAQDMPPLFLTGADGAAQLVNYRVQGRYIVVDRLFEAAELRLGTKKTQQVVHITRDDPRKGKRS